MPPQKPKLHTKTGKLKSISKVYTVPTSTNTNAPTSNSLFGSGRQNTSTPVPNGTSNTSSQTDVQPSTSATASNALPVINSSHDTEVDQQFELELCWCIQSMENTLNSGKLSAKQAADTEKTIKLLKSHNQPVIRKRQIMKTSFGDYRSKMLAEEKKLRLGSRQVQFIDTQATTEVSKAKAHFVKKSLATAIGEKAFKFNFPVPDLEKLNLEDTDEVAVASSVPPQIKPTSTSDTKTQSSKPLNNSNQFIPSDNSFKFNFSLEN